jgi:hypothetical protein
MFARAAWGISFASHFDPLRGGWKNAGRKNGVNGTGNAQARRCASSDAANLVAVAEPAVAEGRSGSAS